MNLPQPWLSALRSSPILSTLPPFDFDVLMGALSRRTLESGQLLFRQGDMGDSLAFVAEGKLDVTTQEPTGSERVIRTLGPGEIIGEMACVDPAPRSANVVARLRSEVFLLDRSLLVSLQEHAPGVIVAFYRGLIKILTARIRETDDRIANELTSFASRPASGKEPRAVASPPPARRLRGLPYRGKVEKAKVPNLAWMPDRDFELLLGVAPPVVYEDGMELCREGDPGASCFLILEGQVGVFKETQEGRRLLATLENGAFVGQLALVDRITRSATVVATGNVVVLEVARDVFERLIASTTSLGVRFQEQIAVAGVRQLRLADTRLATIYQRQAEVRGNLPLLKEQEDERRAKAAAWARTALHEWGLTAAAMDRVRASYTNDPKNRR